MATLQYVLVDVFTDRPLAGNPLAVFTEAADLTPDTMQALARELNLSETTFVLPAESGGTARVRIFTPRAELPFAGHPTLGTGLVLGDRLETDHLTLELGVGHVPVALEREGGRAARGWFTRRAPVQVDFAEASQLLKALGVTQTATRVAVYDNGVRHALVHVTSQADVEGLRPDLNAVERIPVDTVDVFTSEETTATLRVFAPAHGIAEDAATGSAAAPVLCHLVQYAGFDPHATLSIRQGDGMQRPSRLQVRYASETGDVSPLIDVGGAGVTVAEGAFRLPVG